MKRILICIVTTIMFLSSCSKPCWEPFRVSDSYVLEYNCGDLFMQGGAAGNKYVLNVGVAGGYDTTRVFAPYTSGKAIYDSLCIKHNDTANPKGISYSDNFYAYCYYKDFKSIELVSDNDFDSSHKAGTSLLDILTFHAESAANFIASGYSQGPEITEIYKSAAEVTIKDMTLLPTYINMFSLIFDSLPTISSEHNLTLTLVSDDDEVFTAKTSVTFE